MSKFRIQPHGRLQEWVAHENGYFSDEGLDYEFVFDSHLPPEQRSQGRGSIQTTASGSLDVRTGAFEMMEAGRACEVSSACHWMVNMAAAGNKGRMWGQAYTVAPSGIFVPPESPIRKPSDLAGVEVAVGYHSGSHFSGLQALEQVLAPDEIKLRFGGDPLDRLALVLERKVPAANLFGIPYYIAEQQDFRRVLDTTFMIGFLAGPESSTEELEKFFRAMQRAQRDIDLQPEHYKHFFLNEMPEKYHGMVDVRAFGHGERMVVEPYTREMYEGSRRWTLNLGVMEPEQLGTRTYEEAVLR